jgi:Glycosyl hydrolases family 2, TIM barrel domain/Glycosyl hydrolases family 2, sugar binding domain/Glycosyl hydrolases family 2
VRESPLPAGGTAGVRAGVRAKYMGAVLALLFVTPLFGASRTVLDEGWQFRADPDANGVAAGWSSATPPGTESVTLPHTWNVGRLHDYRGVAWYFLEFADPPHPPGAHLELHFGATFYSSRVWLNGVEVGTHEGGFTAYSFDITQHLHGTNLVAVRLDNRPGIATIPGIAARGGPEARYDWWTYGGLVRDVWLTTSGPVWVSRQSIRTEHDGGSWIVHDRIKVGSAVAHRTAAVLRVTALGPDNAVEASESRSIDVARGTAEVAVSLNLPHPKLWSIDQPNVYRMVVAVRDRNKQVLDEDSATFGVRTLEIRDRHLLLNGERVRLTGMARHEDSPWEGLAETRGTIWHDYDDMKALHTTLSRPVHYPQNPLVLDYADRHGILLIPEIPVWQFSEAQLSDPRVIELARRQMREMIEEAGNHPSIFGWSVANESATGTPGGIVYFRALRALIQEIDPGRPVSFADDNLPKLARPEQSAANDADFLMMNQYFGSWHGPATALAAALEHVHQLFPQKMVIISEMGFAGIFAQNPVEADSARIRILQEQMPMLAAHDWIAGAILWCYQDYKSPRNLWPGETEGYVEHGLVDEWRQRKASYGVWKELNRPVGVSVRWVGLAQAVGSAQPVPSGFTMAITPNTESDLPYYALHGYRLVWSVLDAKGSTVAHGDREFADLAEPVAVTDTLPSAGAAGSGGPDASGVPGPPNGTTVPKGLVGPAAPDGRGPAYRLRVTLLSPGGLIAASEALDWPQPSAANPASATSQANLASAASRRK